MFLLKAAILSQKDASQVCILKDIRFSETLSHRGLIIHVTRSPDILSPEYEMKLRNRHCFMHQSEPF